MAPEPLDSTRHEEVWLLLPWWVNDRLDGQEAIDVRQHLTECEACRKEVEAQKRLRQAMLAGDRVSYAPQPGFEKLRSRIEELAREVPNSRVDSTRVGGTRSGQRLASLQARSPVSRWLVAAVIVQAAGLALLAAAVLQTREPSPGTPSYRTVTTPRTLGSRAPRIRAVFAADMTIADLQPLLRRAGVSIVDGPTEHGVYTLGLREADEQNTSALARLRADGRVQFAELAP